jgi:tetratricopeptide (TPR) repeat protein
MKGLELYEYIVNNYKFSKPDMEHDATRLADLDNDLLCNEDGIHIPLNENKTIEIIYSVDGEVDLTYEDVPKYENATGCDEKNCLECKDCTAYQITGYNKIPALTGGDAKIYVNLNGKKEWLRHECKGLIYDLGADADEIGETKDVNMLLGGIQAMLNQVGGATGLIEINYYILEAANKTNKELAAETRRIIGEQLIKGVEYLLENPSFIGSEKLLGKTLEQIMHIGNFYDAIKLFSLAEDKAKLKKCADELLSWGNIEDAIKVYNHMGENIKQNKIGLIKCADKILKSGNVGFAMKAYELAEDKTGLIKCAEKYLEICEGEHTHDAIFAYEKAEDKAGLIKCADILLKNGYFNDATLTYEKAEDKAGLIKCAEKALEHGQINDATLAYEKAEGKAGLIKCADKILNSGYFPASYLIQTYKKAEDKAGLIKCAEKAIKDKWIDMAIKAYKLAGLTNQEMQEIIDAQSQD